MHLRCEIIPIFIFLFPTHNCDLFCFCLVSGVTMTTTPPTPQTHASTPPMAIPGRSPSRTATSTQQEDTTMTSSELFPPQASSSLSSLGRSLDDGLSTSPASSTGSPSSKPKLRCASCRKRVGLTGFTCRCGGLFCGVHRYSDKHDCGFDYKQHERAKLAQLNPAVVGAKLDKL